MIMETSNMHECPNCGQACDCMGDDTWNDSESAFCECECESLDEDEYYDSDDN